MSKILLPIVLNVLANAEGYGYQSWGHHQGHHGPGPYHGEFGSHPWQQSPQQYPQPQQHPGQDQINVNEAAKDAEWICRNPKTGDMMIISMERSSESASRSPWPGPGDRYPGQDERPDRQGPDNDYWFLQTATPDSTVTPDTGNRGETWDHGTTKGVKVQPIPTTIPTAEHPTHGGEQLIDIRFGKK